MQLNKDSGFSSSSANEYSISVLKNHQRTKKIKSAPYILLKVSQSFWHVAPSTYPQKCVSCQLR